MTLSPSARLEAVLFAAGEPLSKKRLATLLELSPEELRDAAIHLHQQLAGRGLALIEAGEEIEIRTSPEAAAVIQKFRESELSRDLGKAGLETLAIILYKNGDTQGAGATRSEIDWIRGVNSAAALRSLTLRGLILRTEDATDRRRIRYTPTIEALAHLGVSSVRQLPNHAEFSQALSAAHTDTVETPSTNEKLSASLPEVILEEDVLEESTDDSEMPDDHEEF